MNRAHRSQLREILLHVTAVRNDREKLHWEIGEDISINKSMAIRDHTYAKFLESKMLGVQGFMGKGEDRKSVV